ncbi:hypothetical protein M422DRAFT_222715 [Sphaerobolus stellatus SS14]|nr:hypothetical protein M422DRAFT_222715 [Sphaerobolus stellatus SS14]
MSTKSRNPKAAVRVAGPEDLDNIVKLGTEAFLHDALMNYFGSLRELLPKDTESLGKENLQKFQYFILTSAILSGGRVTVAVIPDEDGKEKIASAAIWLPPNKRVTLWQPWKLIQSGVVALIKAWGLFKTVKRLGIEFSDGSHNGQKVGFKQKGIAGSVDNSWYLLLVMTDPEHQNQGLMGMLVREAYKNAPEDIFSLDATSAKSRDQYTHLGFEVIKPLVFGKGIVNAEGLEAAGENAIGVTCYSMIKTPPISENSKSK